MIRDKVINSSPVYCTFFSYDSLVGHQDLKYILVAREDCQILLHCGTKITKPHSGILSQFSVNWFS